MLPAQQYRKPASGAVLAALHDINTRCGYLPEGEIRRAAGELGVPLSQVYSAATFYAIFSLKPLGRHTLQVCEGTACYVKGSARLLGRLANDFGLTPDQTSDDQAFTLKRVRCVGSCALAPVVRVDSAVFGRVQPSDLGEILGKYRAEGRPGAAVTRGLL
jgi:NADH-quinone oxidoreductase subunit E/NADP-reducing hydrogenase subunit HndA